MQILFKSNDFFEQNAIKNIWNIFDRFSGLVLFSKSIFNKIQNDNHSKSRTDYVDYWLLHALVLTKFSVKY